MLEGGEILTVVDSDALTAVHSTDNLSVAGDDAYARSIYSAPYSASGCIMCYGLIIQFHIRRHAPWHRHAQNAALNEPCPFARFVDRMLEGDFVFAVQRLRDGAGSGYKCAQAIVAEVYAVGRIDADRGRSPPLGI